MYDYATAVGFLDGWYIRCSFSQLSTVELMSHSSLKVTT